MGFLSIFIEHQHADSPFDLLPDDVIRIIFNKVQDAKTLVASFSLNKRLAFFIPQTDIVSLSLNLPAKQEDNNEENCNNGRRIAKSITNYIFTKLLSCNNNNSCRDDNGDYDPAVILRQHLRPFSQIKHLLLELHSDVKETRFELLKWKANYGKELKSFNMLFCQVLFCNFSAGEWLPENDQDYEPIRRMRALSLCMKAASERHHMVKKILPFFPALQTVTITDVLRQGRLCMAEKDVRELRESLKEEYAMKCIKVEESSFAMRRWCAMRKWHAHLLELPSLRRTWKDAVLMVLDPVHGNPRMFPKVDPMHSGSSVLSMVEVDGGSDNYECDAEERMMFEEAQREILTLSEGVDQTWEWVRSDLWNDYSL